MFFNCRPIHWACTFARLTILSYLLDSRADPNPTNNASVLVPLLYTAKFGYSKLTERLLEFGVPSNQQEGSGRSALHFAAWFGYAPLISILLKYNAIIDIIDNEGRTPLHFASWFGHKDCCDILLKNGANIDAQDCCGRTALHFAVMHERTEIVQLLLQYGANLKLKTKIGKTAEAIAAAANLTEIVEMLQKEEEEKYNKNKNIDDEEETPSRKEIMEEHQRMKNIVAKLVEAKDMQFEEYTALRETIETHGMNIIIFSQTQEDIMRQITQLNNLVYQILLTLNIGLQQGPIDPSGTNGTSSQSSQTGLPSININSVNSTANPGNGMSSVSMNSNATMRPIRPSSITSSGGVPLCKNCMKNEASFRCRQCHSPICANCLPIIKQNGCPFCSQKQ
ncbi:hypothetical protein TRFO_18049 [Tritrichomonas foetus]|uniref:Uncharacterized protein n=1 Tax=Tritrichomonas foetus TaxID=1144522 RepID=A0A1J4KM77_9EUKA|nr:hypothetical protein TRFO_18049 [Tritrichomonas foetus]|eukprot:OHT12242.1 hypothetical protein TRFO_18049 [Tritrichomonas foetus]